MHAMTYAWPQWFDHVQYVVVATNGQVRKTLDIPLMTMMHDMSLTEKYAIIYDQPVTVDFNLLEEGVISFFMESRLRESSGLSSKARDVDDIVWVDVPIGYAFHPMNAFDNDDGSVTIDLCNYEKMFNTDLRGPFGDGLPRL